MTPRARAAVMALAPIVAMATVAIGLHLGAGKPRHGAIVYGAPPSNGVLAWQIASLLADRGVREVAAASLTVRATSGGKDATWSGDANSDGIAEARLEMPWVKTGDAVDLEVRAVGDPAPLAAGRASWGDEPWTPPPASPFVRPSKREGAIVIDAAVLGKRLALGTMNSLWARVTDAVTGEPLSGVTISTEPDGGLETSGKSVTTCALGWAQISVTPIVHVTSLGLRAKAPDGRLGEWYAQLPVSRGASFVTIASQSPAGAPIPVDVHLIGPRTSEYVEVDSDDGRAFAAVLPLKPDASGVASGHLDVPPLAPGAYWIVTAGEPRGADSLEGAALARPFDVVKSVDAAPDACAVGSSLVMRSASGFRKWIALDGLAHPDPTEARRRRLGRMLALGALALAGLIEALLLFGRANVAQRELASLDRELDGPRSIAKGSSGVGFGLAILMTGLGLALLAALILMRS